MNVEELQGHLPGDFVETEVISDTILRSTRKTATGMPYAVYYFDLGGELPGTPESLVEYQERVVGPRYFDGSRSLQWNNYIYFVTGSDSSTNGGRGRAKLLIESDMDYARKFVITEDRLDAAINPPLIARDETPSQSNVQAVWREKLADAGIEAAILTKLTVPKRIELISQSSKPSVPSAGHPQSKPPPNAPVSALPSITKIQLNGFRPYPAIRTFDFGRVNLILGANGTGKTSLLEAIELYYCGRNKRTPDIRASYDLLVEFADGTSDRATGTRPPRLFRRRNLQWYGQPEIKTNNLFESFARFNFLDTDAAANLSSSGSEIYEDLTKLLIGADASTIWDTIQRVQEALNERLRSAKALERDWAAQLSDINKALTIPQAAPTTSTAIRNSLHQVLMRNAWAEAEPRDESLQGWIQGSVELSATATQASRLEWIEQTVTIGALERFVGRELIQNRGVPAEIAALEALEADHASITSALLKHADDLEWLSQVDRFVQAGVLRRREEESRLRRIVGRIAPLLASSSEKELGLLRSSVNNRVGVVEATASQDRIAAQAVMDEADGQHAEFQSLINRSNQLAQELRLTASTILESSTVPDQCPLCHTQFGPGDLQAHIDATVNSPVEEAYRGLAARRTEASARLDQAVRLETASLWIASITRELQLGGDATIQDALEALEREGRELASAQSRLNALGLEISSLDTQGISLRALNGALAELSGLGHRLEEPSDVSIAALRTLITNEREGRQEQQALVAGQIDQAKESLAGILGEASNGVEFARRWSQLEERIAATNALLGKINSYNQQFRWPDDRPLVELAIEVESVLDITGQLIQALEAEQQADAIRDESLARKQSIESRIKTSKAQNLPYEQAQAVLGDIQATDSLERALEDALNHNRDGIQKIFSRIHAPAEFVSLGKKATTLVRESGEEVDLRQVSTGQRAAFALSVFLAQNGVLVGAPPVMLIDDPVAHTDDLNSLAFLDYLRDVVLQGNRQIFFATADHGLATLFTRKFDFLGPEDFRRFDLYRDPIASAENPMH